MGRFPVAGMTAISPINESFTIKVPEGGVDDGRVNAGSGGYL
jgi:hypothetical protein